MRIVHTRNTSPSYIQINNNTDRTLHVVYPRCREFFVHNTLRQEPTGVTGTLSLSLVIKPSMLTPLGVCPSVIVNEKPLNLEKTTSSFLSALLFYLCSYIPRQPKVNILD